MPSWCNSPKIVASFHLDLLSKLQICWFRQDILVSPDLMNQIDLIFSASQWPPFPLSKQTNQNRAESRKWPCQVLTGSCPGWREASSKGGSATTWWGSWHTLEEPRPSSLTHSSALIPWLLHHPAVDLKLVFQSSRYSLHTEQKTAPHLYNSTHCCTLRSSLTTVSAQDHTMKAHINSQILGSYSLCLWSMYRDIRL
jgi:hypothetical protein